MLMDKGEFEAIRRLTLERTLEALSEIFGRGFRSLEELFELIRSIEEPDGLEYFYSKVLGLVNRDPGFKSWPGLHPFSQGRGPRDPEGGIRNRMERGR